MVNNLVFQVKCDYYVNNYDFQVSMIIVMVWLIVDFVVWFYLCFFVSKYRVLVVLWIFMVCVVVGFGNVFY